jgi:pimeloyl-ACP methyl ester carboxylesterase
MALAYEIRGEGAPVVLLPGLTFDRSSWRPVAERLDARAISMDLPEDPLPLTAVADEIHDTLDQIGVHEPVVAGHSISAVIAVIYAGEFPVRGIVDVDQRLNPRPFAELLQRIEPTLRTGDFRAAFQPFQDGLGIELLDEPTQAALLANQRIERELVLGYWQDLLRRSPEELEGEARRRIAAVDAPFLGLFSHRVTEDERAFLPPHAQIEDGLELGHFPHLADPDGFAARLQAFIAEPARALG